MPEYTPEQARRIRQSVSFDKRPLWLQMSDLEFAKWNDPEGYRQDQIIELLRDIGHALFDIRDALRTSESPPRAERYTTRPRVIQPQSGPIDL